MKPDDRIRGEFVKRWLDKAEEDLGVAAHLLSTNTPYLGATAFHAQQAAEKFLKAALVYYQVEFPKTHDLVELLDLIAQVNRALADSLQNVTTLNACSVEVRYPSDFPELTLQEARDAVKRAEEVGEAVRKLLAK
jgi:HEPN domain-containing protein